MAGQQENFGVESGQLSKGLTVSGRVGSGQPQEEWPRGLLLADFPERKAGVSNPKKWTEIG
jgi:hypothetical protein